MSNPDAAQPAAVVETVQASSAAPVEITVDKPVSDSTASGTQEVNTKTESLLGELLGTDSAAPPAGEPPAGDTPPQGEGDQSADQQQADAQKPDEPPKTDTDPDKHLAAPVRGRIKNLEAARQKAESERDQLTAAFTNIDRHLQGVAPDQVNDHLATLGAALRGDAAAKEALAKRLGLTPAAPAPVQPTAPPIDPKVESALKELEEFGHADEVKILREQFAKAATPPEPPKQEQKPVAQQAPAVNQQPPADPAFTASVAEMKQVVTDLTQAHGAQAPAIVDAVGKRFMERMNSLKESAGVAPSPAVFGREMKAARDEVLKSLKPKPAPAGNRPAPGSSAAGPSLTEELIGGR